MSAFLVICILLLVLYFLVPTSIGLKDTKSPEQTNKIFQTVFEEQMNQSEEKEKEEEEERKPKIMEPAYRLEIAPSVSIMGPSGLGVHWECEKSEDCYTKYKIKNEDRHLYHFNCVNNKCDATGAKMQNMVREGQGWSGYLKNK